MILLQEPPPLPATIYYIIAVQAVALVAVLIAYIQKRKDERSDKSEERLGAVSDKQIAGLATLKGDVERLDERMDSAEKNIDDLYDADQETNSNMGKLEQRVGNRIFTAQKEMMEILFDIQRSIRK